MTLQVKGVQIARISALTIRNTLRGANELVCAEYVAQRCKVPLRRAKQIVKTLVSEGYLEFDEYVQKLNQRGTNPIGANSWIDPPCAPAGGGNPPLHYGCCPNSRYTGHVYPI